MPGTEVKDLALAAVIAHPAAEYLATLEPADEHRGIGFGDVKVLAVHLDMRNLKELAESCGDWMSRIGYPQALALSRLPPLEAAVGAHHAAKDLGKVARVQDDQAHAIQDALLNAVYNRILHILVRHMAPPDEHVGIRKHLLCQPMLRLVQSRRARHDVRLGAKKPGDLSVNALGIDCCDFGICLFVPELVPDRHPDLLCHRDASAPFLDPPPGARRSLQLQSTLKRDGRQAPTRATPCINTLSLASVRSVGPILSAVDTAEGAPI